jgi:hypothetical protein
LAVEPFFEPLQLLSPSGELPSGVGGDRELSVWRRETERIFNSDQIPNGFAELLKAAL